MIYFTNQVKVVLESGDEKQIKQLRDQIIEFVDSPNAFYQDKKSEAQKLLTNLENPRKNIPASNSNDFPQKVVISIFLLIVLVIGIVIVMVGRKQGRKK
jgi:hypothetical protein